MRVSTALVDAMETEGGQLDAFARYIEADSALRASLVIGAWWDVENRYNGGGYAGAYAAKLKAAADRYGAGRRTRHECRVRCGWATPATMSWPHKCCWASQLTVTSGGTDAAVRKLQAERGMVVDGIVGTMTQQSAEHRSAGGGGMSALIARFAPWSLIAFAAAGLVIWALWGRLEAAKSKLDAANAVIEQAEQDKVANAKAVRQLAQKLNDTETKVVTVTEKVYAAPITRDCAQSPAMRAASDGLRQLFSADQAADRRQPAPAVR